MEDIENDNIVCYLNDWQTRVNDGPRSTGETYQYRYGLSACTNAWALTEFRSSGTHIHEKYASSLRDLCPFFANIANLDILKSLNIIQSALNKLMSKNVTLETRMLDRKIDVVIDLADQIDNAFQIDFAIHDDIRERIFDNKASV
jgi:hypothetical protein